MCVCVRSEEHTSELQSHLNLVCRLLLEKKIKLILGYIFWTHAHCVDTLSVNAQTRTSHTPIRPRSRAHAISQVILLFLSVFFFNDRAPTEISPLPLHDALPI